MSLIWQVYTNLNLVANGQSGDELIRNECQTILETIPMGVTRWAELYPMCTLRNECQQRINRSLQKTNVGKAIS